MYKSQKEKIYKKKSYIHLTTARAEAPKGATAQGRKIIDYGKSE